MSPTEMARDWWLGPPLKRYTLVATAISVTAGALIGLMNTAGILEPYWVSTREFTRSVVAASEKTTSGRLLALEIATKESSRDNTQSQIDRLELELKKNDTAPDSIKQILNEQIARYKTQIRIIEIELDDLRRQQSKRR